MGYHVSDNLASWRAAVATGNLGACPLADERSHHGLPADKWADVGSLRMRYIDWGGDGPPVIALHGLASSGNWYDIVARLLSDGYRVIAPDQRGHVQTTQASSGYYWNTLA